MIQTASHIVVCDDEAHLREMLCEYLTEQNFRVSLAADVPELNRILDATNADLIILDVKMPGIDGLTALRNLRVNSSIPVIMLSAAVDVIDRIVGLEMGADDYVGKPVDLRELEARVKAALRRQSVNRKEQTSRDRVSGTIPFGPCRLDLDGAKLYGPEGDEIAITAMEFSLLRVFAANRGRILNRDQLLEQAHDKGWEPYDRSIDLRISRIRKKIEVNPAKPATIRTVRGLGYVFD